MDDLLSAMRAIHFAAAAIAAGVVIFQTVVLQGVMHRLSADTAPDWSAGPNAPAAVELAAFHAHLRQITWAALAVAVVTGITWLVLEASHMSGRPLGTAIAGGDVWITLTQTHFGRASAAHLGLAAGLAATAPLVGAGSRRWIATVAAAAFLASIAWMGHAAATPDWPGDIHLAADAAHVLASGAWIGALVPLGLLLTRAWRSADPALGRMAPLVTARFSVLGIVSVGTLVTTGLVNTWFLAGTVPALIGTPYGRILLLKIALFLVMLGIAAVNRQRLTPRLSAEVPGQPAMRQLARNSAIELALGLVIFGLVGVLGTLPPGLHEQPVWPLPVRPSSQAWSDADILRQAIVAVAACIAGVIVFVIGAWWRRLRWPLIIGGAALFLFFAPGLGAFSKEAYPTSFYMSPTGYAATSIVQGHQVFDAQCASCHGADGRGADGRGDAAKAAASREQLDLVGNHVYAYPDGDLFWWITNGVGAAMPGFGTSLDEDARWNLIDFIHANADAARLQALAGKVIARGYRVPNFSLQCGDGASMTVDDLRGKVVHVFAAAGMEPQALARLRARDRAHDARTILIEPSSSAAPEGDPESCVASDPSVTEIMAIYRGVPAAAIAGTELLIDEAGLLRALWFPGARPNWADDDRFMRVLDSLRKTPAAPMAMGGHAHH